MKSAIPTVRTGNPQLERALDALKQNMDEVTGMSRNTGRLEPLPANATLADVIERLNAILDRLQ